MTPDPELIRRTTETVSGRIGVHQATPGRHLFDDQHTSRRLPVGVDKAYFVVGETVSSYDIEQDKATDEWTLTGEWSGLTGDFAAGLDAALDLGTFNLYVFRGTDYVRIPFGTQAVDD